MPGQGARINDFVSGESHGDVGLFPSYGFGPDREEHVVPWDPPPILWFNILAEGQMKAGVHSLDRSISMSSESLLISKAGFS
jgi:hypothetical protein